MTRLVSIALAAAAFVATVQPAAAQVGRVHEGFSRDANQVVKTSAIDYSDLNLSSTRGVEILKSRIQTAANAVCGPVETETALKAEYEACRRDAFKIASDNVRLPQLFAAAARQDDTLQLASK